MPNAPELENRGVYSHRVGDITITAILDGTLQGAFWTALTLRASELFPLAVVAATARGSRRRSALYRRPRLRPLQAGVSSARAVEQRATADKPV